MKRNKASEAKTKVSLLKNVDLSSILTPAKPAPHIAGTKGQLLLISNYSIKFAGDGESLIQMFGILEPSTVTTQAATLCVRLASTNHCLDYKQS